MEDVSLLSTKEVAERLDVTLTTIYQYVKNGKISPVYEDWSVDQTMLFYETDVEKIENERPAGYTTAEVAERLGVHQTTISKQIKEGKISADKVRYRGRMTYFIQEDVLKELQQTYASLQKYDNFYHPQWQYYLFQSFLNEQTKEKGRIIEFNKESGLVLTDSGEKISLDHLKQKGFVPLEHFQDRKTINKPGYVHFQFEQPTSLHSFIYEVIESFYRFVGHKNIKLHVENGYIDIYIKPFLLKQHDDYFNLIANHVKSGKVTRRHNGILLDSGVERLTIYPTIEQKKAIKKLADEQGKTMSEYILEMLDDYLSTEKNK